MLAFGVADVTCRCCYVPLHGPASRAHPTSRSYRWCVSILWITYAHAHSCSAVHAANCGKLTQARLRSVRRSGGVL